MASMLSPLRSASLYALAVLKIRVQQFLLTLVLFLFYRWLHNREYPHLLSLLPGN